MNFSNRNYLKAFVFFLALLNPLLSNATTTVWRLDNNGVTNVTSNFSGLSALTGDPIGVDINVGLWIADTNTLTNSTGTLSHTFSENIIDVTASALQDVGFAVIKTVPVPATAWLFGFGLLGLIGVARRKKA